MTAPIEHRNQACELYRTGHSDQWIGVHLGYTPQTIRNWLHDAGLRVRSTGAGYRWSRGRRKRTEPM